MASKHATEKALERCLFLLPKFVRELGRVGLPTASRFRAPSSFSSASVVRAAIARPFRNGNALLGAGAKEYIEFFDASF